MVSLTFSAAFFIVFPSIQAADIEGDAWPEFDIWIGMDEENKYPDSYDKDLKREVARS